MHILDDKKDPLEQYELREKQLESAFLRVLEKKMKSSEKDLVGQIKEKGIRKDLTYLGDTPS